MLEVRKRSGENSASLLMRFSRRVKQSGILKEARKRRFHSRPENRRKKLIAAKYRAERGKELEQMRKLGSYK